MFSFYEMNINEQKRRCAAWKKSFWHQVRSFINRQSKECRLARRDTNVGNLRRDKTTRREGETETEYADRVLDNNYLGNYSGTNMSTIFHTRKKWTTFEKKSNLLELVPNNIQVLLKKSVLSEAEVTTFTVYLTKNQFPGTLVKNLFFCFNGSTSLEHKQKWHSFHNKIGDLINEDGYYDDFLSMSRRKLSRAQLKYKMEEWNKVVEFPNRYLNKRSGNDIVTDSNDGWRKEHRKEVDEFMNDESMPDYIKKYVKHFGLVYAKKYWEKHKPAPRSRRLVRMRLRPTEPYLREQAQRRFGEAGFVWKEVEITNPYSKKRGQKKRIKVAKPGYREVKGTNPHAKKTHSYFVKV